MSDIRYESSASAAWIAMVSGSTVLVVAGNAGADRLADLWSSVRGDGGSATVLDALTRGGISSTPDFALLELPAGFGVQPSAIEVTVRGALGVTVRVGAAQVAVSGAGGSPWASQILENAIAAEIAAPGSIAATDTLQLGFVLSDGTAPIVRLLVGVAPPADDDVAIEAPVTAPVPAPAPAGAPVSIGVAPIVASPIAPVPAKPPVPIETPDDPGITISEAPSPAVAPGVAPPEGAPLEAPAYDFLFGETVQRTVEDAAIRDEPEDSPPARAGEHDGRTAIGLSAAERKAARAGRQKQPTAPAAGPRFVLDFSTGAAEPLVGSIIVGRAPSASKVSVNSVPRLITIGGPDQDISRNHVQVSLEGGTVMVTDLHSRNGTIVTLPGRPAQRLRGGQPTAVIDGAIIDLGSDVTITVQEL